MKGIVDRETLEKGLDSVEGYETLDVEPGARVGQVDFKSNGKIGVNILGNEYKLSKEAFNDALRSVGLPYSYTKKCPDELLVPHLNYFFNCPDIGKRRFIFKEDNVIGVSKRSVSLVSTREILENVEEVVGKGNIFGFHRPHVSLDSIRLPVVLNMDRDILPNEKFFGGIIVQNSVLGTVPLEMSSYLLREVCSNGAVAIDTLMKWSRKNINYSAIEWAKKSAEDCFAGLEKEFNLIKKLTEVIIEGDPQPVVDSIYKEFNIPIGIQKEISNEMIESGAKTMFDVYNAITKVGTWGEKALDDPDISRKLQLIGSSVCKHMEVCGECHRVK